ncbi:stalk domain-containing protein [Paenibacillus validus]|uniref:Copper amine oxidase n=1 Tax=Paenibacillus validus TaxID=44253 RepID=A0A7X2ZAL4_9BACL|nr:stalk domain-containing protein [Paenibacillus validus]MUG71398.1 copper amine oxidase [Paenibacillus validus]
MNKAMKIIALSILASVIAGGTGASAAGLYADGLRGADHQLLLQVTTYAGTGDMGNVNGRTNAAQFRLPAGIAVKPDGAVLFSDSRNHQIRKIYSGLVTPYAGIYYEMDAKGFPIGGRLDGASDLSLFSGPQGIATDAQGNVYVADTGNHSIRKIDPSGNVSTIAGDGVLGKEDGPGSKARFNSPLDVAVAADGTVYVADTLNHAIRSISPSGQVTTLNAASVRAVEVSPGQAAPAGDFADGALAQAKFNEPSGLALDGKGNLYVSDAGNQRIRYIDLQQGTVTTAAGSGKAEALKDLYVPGGFADGEALNAAFNFPLGLSVTEEGGVVIADSQNHSIRYLLDGQVSTLAGAPDQTTGEADGIEGYAQLHRPTDVAVLEDGSLLVSDAYNNKIRQIRPFRLPANLPDDTNVKVVLDDKWIEFDALPEIGNGRTMVPVRAITEALGYNVTFDDAARAVQLSKDGVTIELYIDRTGVKRIEQGQAGVEKSTDAAPYIKQDRTYVPVRFFAEEIGLDVEWDSKTRTAILRTTGK